MKQTIVIAIFILFATSCKKENEISGRNSKSVKEISQQIKDSLSQSDYAGLDFSKSVCSKFEGDFHFIRIPLRGKGHRNEFILVQTNKFNKITKGAIIDIERDSSSNYFSFDGHISIRSLKRAILLSSQISQGHIVAFHPSPILRNYSGIQTVLLEPDRYTTLPEVVVVGYISNESTLSFASYIALQSLFNQGSSPTYGSGSNTNYYSSLDHSLYSGGSGGGAPSDGSPNVPDEIELEQDYSYDQTSIELDKYFKCFDNLSSFGATYSIQLSTDIPSNKHPNAMVNITKGVGHIFLTITKQNGRNKITQTFGFFPEEPLPTTSPFTSVNSRIIDNSQREINASIQMAITGDQLQVIRRKALELASNKYNIANYNCADFAIEVFNSARTTPIQVEACFIDIPAISVLPSVEVKINRSPQTLFKKLREMKNSGGSEAGNIKIDQTHNTFSPLSKGPCD